MGIRTLRYDDLIDAGGLPLSEWVKVAQADAYPLSSLRLPAHVPSRTFPTPPHPIHPLTRTCPASISPHPHTPPTHLTPRLLSSCARRRRSRPPPRTLHGSYVRAPSSN